MIPVNPTADEILGRRSCRNLVEVEGDVEIAEIFRRSEDVPPHADDAMKKRVRVFWMQESICNREATERLRKAGITVVWNRCMMKEYRRLLG